MNSTSIASECRKLGIDPESLEPIATNGATGDALISVYEVGVDLVAETNGDPIWEQSEGWQALPASLREQAEKNRAVEPEIDPDAQCPKHGCSRARCAAEH